MSSDTFGASPRWLVSRPFDLGWFFGGAALSLVFLALYFFVGAPIVALWWIWLLAFDGPHIGAAFTRTYSRHRRMAPASGPPAGQPAHFRGGPRIPRRKRALGFALPLPALPRRRDVLRLLPRRPPALRIRGALQHGEPRLGSAERRAGQMDALRRLLGSVRVFPVDASQGAGAPASAARATRARSSPCSAYALAAVWLIVLVRFVAEHVRRDGFRLAQSEDTVPRRPRFCCTASSISRSRGSSPSTAARRDPTRTFSSSRSSS